GTPGAGGYRRIVPGAGESTTVRADLLAGASRSSGTRNPLVTFGQFTDMHIIDAQSPARVEFLDRFNDPGGPVASTAPFSSAYRPWEMLTAHVAEAMVRAMNALAGGPVTGRPVDFTICTGDNADNTQHNETRWHIDLLDGRATVRPDSGSTAKWEGVGDKYDKDTAYWHPAGTPVAGSADNYRAKYGYPTVPGLHDACRKPFTSTGLKTDWYSVFGNHDGLVQGTVPALGLLGAIATSFLKVTGLPAGVDVAGLLAQLRAGDPTVLQTLLTLGPAKLVTPDNNRRLQTHMQTVAEHFNTTGTPVGHGYTQANLAANTAYYSFDRGPLHCIALDTVTPEGYDSGSVDQAQFAWLQAQLDANSSRHLDTSGAWTAGSGQDKLILIFSHHTIDTMNNPFGVGRVLGPAVRDLLLRYPNVVGWVNGHTHVNSVTPHARPSGTAVGGGFWEINTASHVDWPQQARVLELVDNGDGTLSIFGTIIDHAAPTAWPNNPSTPLQLAALARELAVNDPQREAETSARDGRRGQVEDRNVELLLKKPF
ncbi:MAG: TIGR03767 family metallophosphoesterase, partial [Actinomycetota bacterium]|nr:TIGR03767 family metallophosphoesterase [Actinomycetota bacterium]